MLDGVLTFLIEVQTLIHKRVGADLRAFAETRDWINLLVVLPLGVLFGAVHALTPGHSKTILATYVVGSGSSAWRGIGVATILSVTHILTAVVIAVAALPLVTTALGGVGRTPLIEDVSRGLLALVGAWMIVRAIRPPAHHHDAGPLVAVMAGLIPCPLTLFAMSFAMARGVPEAGLVFALAMLMGVALTLSLLAAGIALARDWLSTVIDHRDTALLTSARILEGAAGVLLVAFGLAEVWRR